MADIKAFKGVRYNKNLIANMADIITPPYDVINEARQNQLYQANDYNIIRLEYGKKFTDDNENNNRYTRAAQDFKDWQDKQVLLQEDEKAFYLYQQTFQVAGRTITRTGFLATIKAEGYHSGNVLPHEETLPKHKADRFELMQKTMANFSPIFGLYSQKQRTVDQLLAQGAAGRQPDIDITDWDGERHALWVIKDPGLVQQIEAEMAQLKIYIADGHHRYETASLFADTMKQAGITGCDYLMIALVNLFDPGLVVLPTHRLVKNLPNFNFDTFAKNLAEKGCQLTLVHKKPTSENLHQLMELMAEEGKKGTCFGLYNKESLYLITFKNLEQTIAKMPKEKSKAWRSLDVSLLHTVIMEDILGIGPQELAEEGWVGYTRDEQEGISLVDNGEYQFSIFMNSTLVSELLAVANEGEKMPQKSTFFYPKIVAGLVINKLGQ